MGAAGRSQCGHVLVALCPGRLCRGRRAARHGGVQGLAGKTQRGHPVRLHRGGRQGVAGPDALADSPAAAPARGPGQYLDVEFLFQRVSDLVPHLQAGANGRQPRDPLGRERQCAGQGVAHGQPSERRGPPVWAVYLCRSQGHDLGLSRHARRRQPDRHLRHALLLPDPGRLLVSVAGHAAGGGDDRALPAQGPDAQSGVGRSARNQVQAGLALGGPGTAGGRNPRPHQVRPARRARPNQRRVAVSAVDRAGYRGGPDQCHPLRSDAGQDLCLVRGRARQNPGQRRDRCLFGQDLLHPPAPPSFPAFLPRPQRGDARHPVFQGRIQTSRPGRRLPAAQPPQCRGCHRPEGLGRCDRPRQRELGRRDQRADDDPADLQGR